jgi:hypothetical protein
MLLKTDLERRNLPDYQEQTRFALTTVLFQLTAK